MEDELDEDRAAARAQPVNTNDKYYNNGEKPFNNIDKSNEKSFGSTSSSSSSSTMSTAVPPRLQPPDLADVHHEQKVPTVNIKTTLYTFST